MTGTLRLLRCALLLIGGIVAIVWCSARAFAADALLAWPEIRAESRPWAYNWWLGSAVDKENLTRELTRYRDGGLGGIHIIPIYGAKGAEARYIEYLSPRWMEMLRHAISEANRLGMGADMTTGTGWCFGGPQIRREQGGWRLQTRTVEIRPGTALSERFDPRNTVALRAVSSAGQSVDLLPRLQSNGAVAWAPSDKAWTIYALAASPGGPAVKRSSPGGAGPMINPLDPAAMRTYLARFTQAFSHYDGPLPRSMYHDSYEYNSSWMPTFLQAFARRRGYRLEDQLAAFCGDPARDDLAARVRGDYKETLSDLMVEEVFPQWIAWCRERSILTRNEAHGSPANILDLYALADIPETEMFGRGDRDPLRSGFDERFGQGDRDPLVSKFASSAAHVAGRNLAAAETGTWMAEHFCETLEELKALVDLLFVSGVNHVIYHGCCYSPDDAPWPGWLFYASTQMNPRNPIWHDAPALNAYIARCQSILQSGRPDNDLLVYWPIHDFWHGTPQLVFGCTVHNRAWLESQPIGKTARWLWKQGYAFDYISDRQLAAASARDGRIVTAGASYGAIIVPPAHVVPLATMQKLIELADGGATIIFQDRLADDVPGAGDLGNRRAALRKAIAGLDFQPAGDLLKQAKVGRGRIVLGQLPAALVHAAIPREPLSDFAGALFIRRTHQDGRSYFIANQSMQLMDGWFSLSTAAASIIVMDPMTGRSGLAPVKVTAHGSPSIHLRLEPGQSIILRTSSRKVQGPEWSFTEPGQVLAEIKGPWSVRFVEGGPKLPKTYETPTLQSWTKSGDSEAERFGGTAVYRTTFSAPSAERVILDLGRIHHSARVRVNGREVGTLIMKPYRIALDNLKPTGNVLEVEVTSLAANRIRDLDRRKVSWRIFNDINLVNLRYRPFDASQWPIMDCGLLGPVTLRAAQ